MGQLPIGLTPGRTPHTLYNPIEHPLAAATEAAMSKHVFSLLRFHLILEQANGFALWIKVMSVGMRPVTVSSPPSPQTYLYHTSPSTVVV